MRALRKALLLISLAALGFGAFFLVIGERSPALTLLIWGGILLAALVYERFRYKPLVTRQPGPNWERTSERFVDAETGKTVTVYVERDSGDRQYVEE
ncbi:MAG TPA: hypothetical protein VGF97_09945 [Rhizomicrobium sp.]